MCINMFEGLPLHIIDALNNKSSSPKKRKRQKVEEDEIDCARKVIG